MLRDEKDDAEARDWAREVTRQVEAGELTDDTDEVKKMLLEDLARL